MNVLLIYLPDAHCTGFLALERLVYARATIYPMVLIIHGLDLFVQSSIRYLFARLST